MPQFISIILVLLFVFGVTMKAWKYRQTFANLSYKEWIQYIFGLSLSVAFAYIVIIMGTQALNELIVGVVATLFKIILIIFALIITTAIFIKIIPDPLKPIYYRQD